MRSRPVALLLSLAWALGACARSSAPRAGGGRDASIAIDGPPARADAGMTREAGRTPPDRSTPIDAGPDAAPDALRPIDNALCPWRLPGADGGVAQGAVTVATPFAAPDDTLSFTPPRIPCAIFAVTDYGARGDGATENTDAFARAIAAATAAGGGVVSVPAGSWLTGPIHLASRIELHLAAGATLLLARPSPTTCPRC